MCWTYSAALVEEYLGTRIADTALFVRSNSIRTVDLYLCAGKTTDTSRLSRYGMTFERLTGNDGEALLTWYREVFLVTTSVVAETGAVLEAKNRPFGLRCSASFGKFDRNTSSWKTPMNLFGTDSMLSSKAWTRAGTMRNGECWERPMLVRPTSENDVGFSERVPQSPGKRQMWRTPIASMGGRAKTVTKRTQIKLSDQIGGKPNPEFIEWLMGFPAKWSGLEVLAMPKYRSVPPSHGKSFMSESTNNKEAAQ